MRTREKQPLVKGCPYFARREREVYKREDKKKRRRGAILGGGLEKFFDAERKRSNQPRHVRERTGRSA